MLELKDTPEYILVHGYKKENVENSFTMHTGLYLYECADI